MRNRKTVAVRFQPREARSRARRVRIRMVLIGLAVSFVLVGAVWAGYYYLNNIKGYAWLEVREWVDEPGRDVVSEYSRLKAKAREDWKFMSIVELAKHNNAAKIGYFLPGSENTYFTIIVEEVPGKVNFMIENSIKVLDENLPSVGKDFKKVNSGRATLRGLGTDALVYEFSNLSSGVKSVITGEQVEPEPYTLKKIIFLKSEKMYYIDFAARSHEYKRDVKEFNKIIESLRIE